MVIDTDAEVLRLRSVLRDLVALSAIPATWIGRDPSAVAAGLADALIGLLQVDFASVRLWEPGGAGAVEVMRGDAWTTFPQWLDRHLAAGARLSGKKVIPDVGGGEEPCRGVVIPIGVNAEGGVVAVACDRSDFPTESEQLLLSLAANYAASAFQSARLLHERRRAEAELREARNELEVKVAERTAELRRSEGYLAEAQRLGHTGSFAFNVRGARLTHSSDEHTRLFGFDPEQGVPPLEAFLERVHPEDRARWARVLERAIREAASLEMEYRIVVPGSAPKYIRALAHPVLAASGELEEFVGTAMDVTDRTRAEEERRAQLWFFESMDGISRAIQGAGDPERMMGDVLDVVLAIFSCDRAWLLHPGDSEVSSHRVRMERTRPEYIGAFGLGAEIPNDPEVASVFRTVLASGGPVRFDPESRHPLPSGPAEGFSIRSMMVMAGYPKVAKPYLFGLHQCSHPRVWTSQEERLFQEIGRRLADALDRLFMLRDLRDANRQVEASRDELRALAEEQAALRRVATLVARGAPPEEVFAAVTEEVGHLLPVEYAELGRYEPDRTVTFVASWGRTVDFLPVGSRWMLEGKNLSTIVFETARPARIESYADASGPVGVTLREHGIRSAVGTPIIVEGRLWGVMTAGSSLQEALPANTEVRLASFTELLATAIANAESRAGLARLAEEQAALRRVATLVARGTPPERVFAAVTEEIGQVLPVDLAGMGRYESDGTVTTVGVWGRAVDFFPVGSRWPLGGKNLSTIVFETGRAARTDSYGDASELGAAVARETGIRSAVGTPIIVEGRLWGVMIVGSTLGQVMPADTEPRLASFTEPVATAIANAGSRAALAASRARIAAAADETRRRIERDLHDGTQQRLVSLGLELRAAQAAVPPGLGELEGELSRVADGLASVCDELREISHGIHPAILSERGLGPALRALARRSAVPVELDVRPERRLPERVEVAAYYVVSEALTNAAKHAHASVVHVDVDADDSIVQLAIRDDGVGRADPVRGSGLIGLTDRVEALGGRMEVASPAGRGTSLLVRIPIDVTATKPAVPWRSGSP
jgi:signal transduction histidine kinase/PAS domain-containing protein